MLRAGWSNERIFILFRFTFNQQTSLHINILVPLSIHTHGGWQIASLNSRYLHCLTHDLLRKTSSSWSARNSKRVIYCVIFTFILSHERVKLQHNALVSAPSWSSASECSWLQWNRKSVWVVISSDSFLHSVQRQWCFQLVSCGCNRQHKL